MREMMANRLLLRRLGLIFICGSLVLFGIERMRNSGKSERRQESTNVASDGTTASSSTSARNQPNLPTTHRPTREQVPAGARHVQVGEILRDTQAGRLEILNKSNQPVPELAFGTFNSFKAGPTAPGAIYSETMTKGGYEQWFKDNQTFSLVGFDNPPRSCKSPVQLGQVPKEAHSLKVTITLDDEQRCLGVKGAGAQSVIAMGDRNLEIEEPMVETQHGSVKFRNLTSDLSAIVSIPGWSSNLQTMIAAPGSMNYLNMNKSGYERLFRDNPSVTLVGFDRPTRYCKVPIELARLPKVAHNVTILITEESRRKCLDEQ